MKIITISKQHEITFLLICDCSLELIIHKKHDKKYTSYEHHYIIHGNSNLQTSQITTILAIDEQHEFTLILLSGCIFRKLIY